MPRSCAWARPAATPLPDSGQTSAGQSAMLVDKVLQVAAGDVLHHDVGSLVALELALPRVVDPHYDRVRKFGGGAALTLKTRPDVRAAKIGLQNLYGHRAIQHLVPAQKNTGTYHRSSADI